MNAFDLVKEGVAAIKTYGMDTALRYVKDELKAQGMEKEAAMLTGNAPAPVNAPVETPDYVEAFVEDPIGAIESLRGEIDPETVKGAAAIEILDKLINKLTTVEVTVWADDEDEE